MEVEVNETEMEFDEDEAAVVDGLARVVACDGGGLNGLIMEGEGNWKPVGKAEEPSGCLGWTYVVCDKGCSGLRKVRGVKPGTVSAKGPRSTAPLACSRRSSWLKMGLRLIQDMGSGFCV